MKSWKNVLLSPRSTIRDALNIINNEALRVALVVDSEFFLLGIVTDGDIRRGLLRDLSLESTVDTVMNKSPITVSVESERKELVSLMQENSILSVPLINELNQLVGLESLENALEPLQRENPVFIMAGGFGTRLRPLTDTCPKPMLKVGGRPMLEILLDSFIYYGFNNFYISTHYMPDQIQNYFGDGSSKGISITYVHEEEPLGTGGALGLLPDSVPDLPLILINGDVLTSVDFGRVLDFHALNKATATMCVREYDYQIPYGVINGDGRRVLSMDEKPVQRFFVNAGIYVLNPDLFRGVPENKRIDMPTLLEQKISENKEVVMFPIHEYWMDIGRMEDFERAQTDVKGLFHG